ncbi:hypothetical protein [Amycolatopsis thermoflava]|uniref:hypothetical protein n=1 Tax=Amycolatopsis thermoflava TaxID=84480 RepID=UPI00055CC6B4|nr:hypothetical protein [Amycolatopsis thermoflava]
MTDDVRRRMESMRRVEQTKQEHPFPGEYEEVLGDRERAVKFIELVAAAYASAKFDAPATYAPGVKRSARVVLSKPLRTAQQLRVAAAWALRWLANHPDMLTPSRLRSFAAVVEGARPSGEDTPTHA